MKVKSWMKRGIVAVLLFMVLAPTQAGAFGLGPYLTGKAGGREYSEDDLDSTTDYTGGGIGIVLDTAVAADRLFNYRLQLGYAGVSYEREVEVSGKKYKGDWDADRFEMTHSFGFALLRNENVRLWVGPQINIYGETIQDDETDTVYAGFSLGPVIGVNVHLGPVVSLFAQLSARYGGFAYDSNNDDEYEEESDGDGTEWIVSGDIGVLFRLGSEK